jgi:lactoylglutathione lyase
MTEAPKARMVGFNHVALEVGDIDEALAFYGRIFQFELRGRDDSQAFIDLGDQFIALQKGRRQPADDGRHFGLVVDDKETARQALIAAGVELVPGPFLDFRDPWASASARSRHAALAQSLERAMGLRSAQASSNSSSANTPFGSARRRCRRVPAGRHHRRACRAKLSGSVFHLRVGGETAPVESQPRFVAMAKVAR